MYKMKLNKWLLAVLAVVFFVSYGTLGPNIVKNASVDNGEIVSSGNDVSMHIKKGYAFSTKDEVAAYIHKFNSLPSNFITKKEAEDAGWDSRKENLWQVTDKKSIGGDRFGNREGLLPKAGNRKYYECDINYSGGSRGPERIVYSNDGLVFYTGDHYKNFERLY